MSQSEINQIKPEIRSIILSLGRRTTEIEFRRAYYNFNGTSFNTVLSKFHLSFQQFMKKIPDVVKVWHYNETVFIERVSTDETSHMDQLTIIKNKRPKPSSR